MSTITAHPQAAPVTPVIHDVPMVAFTCPSCDGHNVTDKGLGMTAKARFTPSRFAQTGGSARSFDSNPRAYTISGNID
jgi:hypothetical protein